MASALTRWDRPAFPAIDSRAESLRLVCWPGILNCMRAARPWYSAVTSITPAMPALRAERALPEISPLSVGDGCGACMGGCLRGDGGRLPGSWRRQGRSGAAVAEVAIFLALAGAAVGWSFTRACSTIPLSEIYGFEVINSWVPAGTGISGAW